MTATQPECTFDPESHCYRIDGRAVPSVTEVISAILPGWQAEAYFLQRGRALHYACELDDRGVLDWESVSVEIEGRVLAWRKFRNEWPACMVESERQLFSTAYNFAGTFDRVFERDGRLIIADLKSTCEPQVRLQLGGYSLLWKEWKGIKNRAAHLNGGVAIQLNSDETYRTLWVSERELSRHESQFLAALTLFGFAKAHNLKGSDR